MQGLREPAMKSKCLQWVCGLVLVGMMVLIDAGGGVVAQAAIPPSCTNASAKETDGIRRLALVVGVGKYKNKQINPLVGPEYDARRIYSLLTGDGGYQGSYEYPKENVCLLLDEQATIANFKSVFDQALVKRAKPKDVVVIFFAGHGSQTPDLNNDEGDGTDETLLFHDSWTNGADELIDDEFNAMLQQLHQRTQHITVILDSCHSGTAVRGDTVSLRARYQERLVTDKNLSAARPVTNGDGSPTFMPKDLPGLVLLSAAGDRESAMEDTKEKEGLFTAAIWTVFSRAPKPPLTYGQAQYQIQSLVAARSSQTPGFHGDLTRTVFGNEKRAQAMGMRVRDVGKKVLTLSGPPLPGLGVNAEIRIYDGKALGNDTQDPRKAKGTYVIEKSTGLDATAREVAEGPGKAEIRRGDLAVLVRPADDFLKLTVRLRPATKIGGIPVERATAIRNAIQENSETQAMITLVEEESLSAAFELSLRDDQQIVLRDQQNQIRNAYTSGATEASDIADSLWQHARQIALHQLRGEGGWAFKDQETLQVSVVPTENSDKHECLKGTFWVQAKPNTPQEVPLGQCYQVKVTLSPKAKKSLVVGGFMLSSDGSVLGFESNIKQPLEPGKSTFLEQFYALPPVDVNDHLVVVGTHPKNAVQWTLLTSTVNERAKATRGGPDSKKGQTSTLGRALERYLVPGVRGAAKLQVAEDSPWTLSRMTVIVRANSSFLVPANGNKQTGGLDKREYTIPNFDILPYMPNDGTTALARVLYVADSLARYSEWMQDGVGYAQHTWAEKTDEDNLKKGIDCSRAIWFAFTRAGLPYNHRGDAYIPTAEMVNRNGLMSDEFDTCQGKSIELGDVLVYRDEKENGHTVMVIDPPKRIAWGSHGWDGNILEGKPSDTGVEYQLLKYKQDWKRWDRTPTLKACWRYRQITEEATTGRGVPGQNALLTSCTEQACRSSGRPDQAFLNAIRVARP